MVRIILEPVAVKVGDFVYVRFGIGSQVARVEGFTRTGKPKVRAFNASRYYWMPTLRTIDPLDVISEAPPSTTSYLSLGIGYNQEPLPELN